MMREQLVPALIAGLLAEGVEAEQIERAVARVRDIKPGQSISGHALRRAFAFEQAKLLERAQTGRYPTHEEIADALDEAMREHDREPQTDLWKSFWDRLTEGDFIPPRPEAD